MSVHMVSKGIEASAYEEITRATSTKSTHRVRRRYLKARGHTVVSEATLVETQGPVRNLCRQPNNFGVLLGKSCRVCLASGEEVEVENATNDIILQRRSARGVIGQLDVHAVGVEQQNAMGACGPMLVVDWVVSVEIGARRNAIGVSRPKSQRKVVRWEMERIGVLAKAIDMCIIWQLCLDTKILRLEDEGMRRGVEEYFFRRAPVDLERERRGRVIELDVGRA